MPDSPTIQTYQVLDGWISKRRPPIQVSISSTGRASSEIHTTTTTRTVMASTKGLVSSHQEPQEETVTSLTGHTTVPHGCLWRTTRLTTTTTNNTTTNTLRATTPGPRLHHHANPTGCRLCFIRLPDNNNTSPVLLSLSTIISVISRTTSMHWDRRWRHSI